MGRLKRHMKRVHRRKLRKAREQVRLYNAGKLKPGELSSIARRILLKRLKAGHRLPDRMVKEPAAPTQEPGGVA